MSVLRPHRTRVSGFALLVLFAVAALMVGLVVVFVLAGLDSGSIQAPGRLPSPRPIS